MGGGSHDFNQTNTRVANARRGGQSVMGHSASIASGAIARVHPSLDPKRKNRDGVVIRESRDSDEHPNSTPIAVIFDTTGSMGAIPVLLVEKLGGLMKLLNERKYVPDPQILFGAINDMGNGSIVPLEMGQFESGNQMDDVVTNIWSAQSGGGGNMMESYELAMYFLARKTVLDSVLKRNKKGYCFIIGDEKPYPNVNVDEVKNAIGDTIGENIPTETILAELKEKFDVFWIMPNTENGNNRSVNARITELFGERVLRLDAPGEICSFIAATIAINEGQDARQVMKDLRDAGANDAAAKRIADSVAASIPPRNITLGAL